jgi:hypothetical protein
MYKRRTALRTISHKGEQHAVSYKMNRKEKTDYKQGEQQGERKGNNQEKRTENKRLMQSKRSRKS